MSTSLTLRLDVPRLRFTVACLKISLLISSIVLWIQGIIFASSGVFTHNFLKTFFTDGKGLKQAGGFPVASIILGVLIIVATFVIKCVLVFPTRHRYFGVSFALMGLIAFEIILLITGFEYGSTMTKTLADGFETAMINYADGFITNIELNLIQWKLQCCGFKDFREWYGTRWANGKVQVPESCCIDGKQCHNLNPVMVDDIYVLGCKKRLESAIQTQNKIFIVVIAITAVTQLLGILFAISLAVKYGEVPIIQRERSGGRPIASSSV